MQLTPKHLRKNNVILHLNEEGDDTGQVEVFKSVNLAKKKVRSLQAGNKVGLVRVVDRFPKTHIKQKEDSRHG